MKHNRIAAVEDNLLLPVFWQTPCYMQADLSNEMVLIVSRGFGRVCKQHSFARVSTRGVGSVSPLQMCGAFVEPIFYIYRNFKIINPNKSRMIKKIDDKDISKLFTSFNKYLVACKSEEELREMFSLRVLPFIGIPDSSVTHIRHEYSVLKGRIDSLYGCAILEFKAPGEIPQHDSNKKFIAISEQVERHITGVSKKDKIETESIIGIIFDGKRIAYQYHVEGATIVKGPYTLDKYFFKGLIEKLLFGLTAPKAFSAKNLISDFGLASPSCVPFVRLLYQTLTNSTSKRTSLLFEQWKIYFREICGYNFNSEKNLRRIASVNYGIPDPSIEALTFCIHSYFSIILTLIATKLGDAMSASFDTEHWLKELASENEGDFQKTIESVFDNEPFKEVGFTNLIEPTFFTWFISEKNLDVNNAVREAVKTISQYSTSTLKLHEIGDSDILKELYQSLSPRELRHALGEYYTPAWLADHTLNRVGYTGKFGAKTLDPTCGSGTFIIRAMLRYMETNKKLKPEVVARGILNDIRGIDLNPLAVAASKINYLITMGEVLLKSVEGEQIELPIYLSDAMLAPLEHKFETSSAYIIPTKVANFSLNKSFVDDSRFLETMTLLEESIKNKWTFDIFSGLASSNLKWDEASFDLHLRDTHKILTELEAKGLNGIWAGIIKNFFAPTFLSQFDFIIGNPPWVNWENLPESYRDSIKKYWSIYAYNLFRITGLQARLGSAHDDICVLLTYIVCDIFLKFGGKVGFVLPQTLFKSKGGGDGFRGLQIKDNFCFNIISVDDMAKIQPFDAANKTSIFCASKAEPTKPNKYPVKYFKWSKPNGIKLDSRHTLEMVMKNLKIATQTAIPIDKAHVSSPWLTGDSETVKILYKLVGNSSYQARKGVDTSLNAVYWVKKLAKNKKLIQVENCQTKSKSEVRQRKAWIEEDVLYSVLRGKDFGKWKFSLPYFQVLLYDEAKGKALDLKTASAKFPNAFKYFSTSDYAKLLKKRAIYTKHLVGEPFYACYDIGKYSFAEYKVVWKALGTGMQACVIGKHENKIIVPDHNVMMIPFDKAEEAHFICSILNSDLATLFVTSYIEWFFSTHILEYFNIPTFDSSNKDHKRLVELSKSAHVSKSDAELIKTEKELNKIVNKLFGV